MAASAKTAEILKPGSRKGKTGPKAGFLFGATYGDRTHDHRSHNPVLYQLS